MKHIIEKKVIFDSESHQLLNITGTKKVDLAVSSSLLLAFMLEHKAETLARSTLFDAVFDPNGIAATDGNLNQHIMLIRRAFQEVELENDVIITVPKVGFRIAALTIDTEINGTQLKPPSTVNSKPFFIALGVVVVVFLLSLVFFFHSFTSDVRPSITITQNSKLANCTIHYFEHSDTPAAESVIQFIESKQGKLDCQKDHDIYYFSRKPTNP